MSSNHVESLLPKGKKWKLVWNDEFDGDKLDESKWSYRLHIMHRRHETFSDGGVIFDGKSNILLPLIKDGDHYRSPHLQTGSNFMDVPEERYEKSKLAWPIGKFQKQKFLHKYGYYECRCKLQTQPGWWSAFWLQSPIIGATADAKFSGVEVDIMENFTRDGLISHNNHWDGYGSDHKHVGSGNIKVKDTADGFHVFGLDWSLDGYTYYIDGEKSWHVDGPVSDREQFILISTECEGYRNGDTPSERLKTAVLPDYFIVDYVRVFDTV
ncbi:MAG: glycoside hydrolase family 16 protein [Spirochaetes bacterium]|nr:glycoside hydrolase family 16 protein [Spirochaetota bacterium]